MQRIAVYYRVSTKKQDYEIQEAAFNAWVAKLPGEYQIHRFADKRSGNAIKRPSFDNMINQCRQGKLDHIVVYAIDRFSRNKAAGLETVLELARLKVAFTSLTQSFLCSDPKTTAMPFQNVLLAAFTEIASIERETIVSRVKAGMAVAKAKGVKLGKPRALSPLDEAKVKARFGTVQHITLPDGSIKAVRIGIRALAAEFDVGHSCIQRIINEVDIHSQHHSAS